jgi:hypothetical protein
MNVRRPLTVNASNTDSERPYDVVSTLPLSSFPSLRNGSIRASPSAGAPLHVGTIIATRVDRQIGHRFPI